MGLGSSKPTRQETEGQVEESDSNHPSPRIAAAASEGNPAQSQEAQSGDVVDLSNAPIDERTVNTLATPKDTATAPETIGTFTAQDHLAVLRQAALRSALEKRKREAANVKESFVPEIQAKSLLDKGTTITSHGNSASTDTTSRLLVVPKSIPNAASGSVSASPHVSGPWSPTNISHVVHDTDVDMDGTSTTRSTSEPFGDHTSRRSSEVSNGVSDYGHTHGFVQGHVVNSMAGSSSVQHHTVPLQLTTSRDTDESHQYDDMDIDHDSSDDYQRELSL